MRKSSLFAALVCLTLVFSGCSSDPMIGTWKAQWVTDPASYPDVDKNVEFTMDGLWDFKADGKVTISAYGHKGCIFSSDTLIHSLNWKLNNDTLKLVNENDVHGMTYTVLNLSSDKMKLQLMEDIFLNLDKI